MPDILTATDLALLRNAAASARKTTIQVQRRTDTPDGAGGRTSSWATIATVDGLVRASNGREIELAGRLGTTTEVTALLPNGTDVKAADRLVTGGQTLQITAVLTPRTWEINRRCFCVEAK